MVSGLSPPTKAHTGDTPVVTGVRLLFSLPGGAREHLGNFSLIFPAPSAGICGHIGAFFSIIRVHVGVTPVVKGFLLWFSLPGGAREHPGMVTPRSPVPSAGGWEHIRGGVLHT